MRKTAVAIALVLIAALGIAVPTVAAATGGPKVVIIVGATHGATAGYRADADRAYAEAIKYTSNVVKVYSPNATWAKVKAAVVDATVVIYMGHGNGWPSPYTYDAKYTTKDGFGLNATAGAGDSNNTYYGEPYVSTLAMAPGAIVMLHHLCYASGNSEPGAAEPSISVARQRADNYAAGFLKGGASAVLVDGHAGPERYLRDLFTTHQSLEDLWRNQSSSGNIVSFPSTRTPGATVFQDPNTPTSGFYRALSVRSSGVTTDEVVSAGYGDTGADPASMVIPGNASVSTDGATLYAGLDTTGGAATTLPAGTRLRLVDQALSTTAVGDDLVEVVGIDDPGISGFMRSSDITPRDSTAPHVRVLDVGAGRFSPNGDGSGDKVALRARFTESVAWTFRARDGSNVLWEKTGTGATAEVEWDGKSSGSAVPDGSYDIEVTGADAWDNAPASSTRHVTVDTVAPQLDGLTPDASAVQWFSPNGDGARDTVSVNASNSEVGSLQARVRNSGGTVVRTFSVGNDSGAAAVTWNGRNDAAAVVPDGDYVLSIAPVDLAGNTGRSQERSVQVVAALGFVISSKSVFYPQDLDTLAQGSWLKFTLSRPMNVTWNLRDAAGNVVVSHLIAAPLPAGVWGWYFNGRAADGAMLPTGRYVSDVSATDGTLSASQAVAFEMNPFTLTPTDTTPGRGQTIKIYTTSAESLKTAPTLVVYQPGVKRWTVRMVRTGTNTYKVTIKLKTTGGAGPVTFRIKGTDTKGHLQGRNLAFTLH